MAQVYEEVTGIPMTAEYLLKRGEAIVNLSNDVRISHYHTIERTPFGALTASKKQFRRGRIWERLCPMIYLKLLKRAMKELA